MTFEPPNKSEVRLVSDDTPAGETEPTPPPAEAAAQEPAPVASGAEAVQPINPEPPVAAEPVAAAEAVTPQPVTPEPVTTEAATAETVVAPAAVAAAPVATAAAPPPERRGGILLPTWAAVVIAVLLIGGLGFAIGYWTGDDNSSDSSNASSTQVAPTVPSNNGGGNTGTVPTPNGNGSNGNTTAQTAFLGVSVDNVANNGGAQVTAVGPNSPAATAGLKTGDVITKIGDTTVQNDADLIRAIRSLAPGDNVTVTYTRNGTSAQVKVTLGDRSDATRG